MADPIHKNPWIMSLSSRQPYGVDSQTFVSTRQESKLASPSRFNFTRSLSSFDLIIALVQYASASFKALPTLCQPWLQSSRRPWCQDCLTSERQLVGMGVDSPQVLRATRYPGAVQVILFHFWRLAGEMEMKLTVLWTTISVSTRDFLLLLVRMTACMANASRTQLLLGALGSGTERTAHRHLSMVWFRSYAASIWHLTSFDRHRHTHPIKTLSLLQTFDASDYSRDQLLTNWPRRWPSSTMLLHYLSHAIIANPILYIVDRPARAAWDSLFILILLTTCDAGTNLAHAEVLRNNRILRASWALSQSPDTSMLTQRLTKPKHVEPHLHPNIKRSLHYWWA